MKITTTRLLNILFSLFIISTIIMQASYIGKLFQLLFVFASLILNLKRIRITNYNLLEWFFVVYVILQVVFKIAELPKHTLDMAVTLTYTALFSVAFYNYVIYTDDLYEVSKIYVGSTIAAFIFAALLYHESLTDLRLSASDNITIGGFVLFGGASSTALALQAAIPAFFFVLFSVNRNKHLTNIYCLVLFLFAVLTGTRKVLVLFIYIIFFVNRLLKNDKERFKLLKIFIITMTTILLCYFAIMKIPVLYNIIGYRINNMIVYFRLGETSEASLRGRERMLREAVELYLERRFFGWGMDYYKYGKNLSLGYYCHNNFLELLSGGGIIGFIIYYSRYVYLLINIAKAYIVKKRNRYYGIILMGMLILMTILEYWQVTYFYRYILLTQVFILGIINHNEGKKEIIKEKNKINSNFLKKRTSQYQIIPLCFSKSSTK